ncbi:MAG: c-type cytochrome, partial [Planctomycetota bacterium]|nr:c-type cytochrome [Planctomycetota bacterium]
AEDGYYHRQAGAYPPHTWKAGSIVDHRHQKAAYCGLHYLDSDRYPEPYRGVLVMGNLHGAALNVDRAEQRGSTYHARELPDLLRANDAWFMPVSMLTGPDGYLYVLDWYDRYHCYQDARRDPEGIDRGRGRLWRVVHEDQPYEPWTRDLARETDHKLLRELGAPNDALRRLARLEIASRRNIQTSAALEGILLDAERPRIERLEALYALATGWGAPVEAAHLACLSDADPGIRAWAVRLARRTGSHAIMVRVRELFEVEQDPRVQLQLASAWPDFEGRSNLTLTLEHLYGLIDRCGDDPIVPRVVWRQLVGMLTRPRAAPLEGALPLGPGRGPAWDEVYPRLVGLLLERRQLPQAVYALRASQGDQQLTADALVVVREQVQTGELRGEELERLEAVLELDLQGWLAGDPTERLTLEAALLATALGDERGLPVTRHVLGSPKGSSQTRLAALEALVAADDPDLLTTVEPVLADPATPTALRGELIAALGRLDRDEVGALVVRQFAALEPALQPRAVSLCLQRLPWARSLLAAMPEPVPPTLLNASQALRIAAFGDPELDALLEASWGRVRAARNPDREAVIARGRRLVREGGDAHKGAEVFTRVCATCHTIHGEGANVGPDVTGTGRGDLMQLLSNVFDPSLVVGADYRQQVVRTVDGRILGGLLVEDSQDRIVLRVEGGRDEVIPREDVDVSQASSTSLMPEGFEAQLTQDELRDLLAFLVLDGPPGDPNTRMIPGAGLREIETEDPAEFGAILAEVAPGFTCDAVGDDGMALEAEHLGRPVVVRSHPVSPTVPAVLYGTFNIPEDASLLIRAAHHPRGDWRMIVRVGEEVVLDVPVTKETCQEGWMERWVDLGPWQNQQVFLRIENHATGWHNEYGYWGAIEIVRGGGSKK